MGSITGYDESHWNVIKDIGNGKLLCKCDCGTEKIVNKYSVLHGKTLSCGCTKRYKPLKNKKFNYWKVLDDIDSEYALCECVCGTVRKVQKAHLKNGTSKSCGCKRDNIDNCEEQTYNYLTIKQELGEGKVVCQCICGNVREYNKYQVRSGIIKSCGCMSSKLKTNANFIDLTNQKFGEWEVQEELGNSIVRCKCSCGTIRDIHKQTLLNGTSKSCGHNTTKFVDLTNKTFDYLTVKEELGYGMVKCECKCGNIIVIQKSTLISGKSKSCGCMKTDIFRKTLIERYNEVSTHKINNPRNEEQINALSSKDAFKDFIEKHFNYKPTIKELVDVLDINEASVGRIINKYDLYKSIDYKPMVSSLEKVLCEYIKTVYNGDIKTSVRDIISPYELDIYIPEKRLAIEFNGDYWHSSIFKEPKYHQQKTIACAKKGVRLVHIFEHEYIHNEYKIKSFIKNILSNDNTVYYARNTVIKEIDTNTAKDFCEKYHLQGWSASKIALGCYKDEELLSIMTFSKPRFDNSYQYELIRYCTKTDIGVIGGAQKIFSYFVNRYNVTSVITYSDISKFTGNIYTKLGFEVVKITSPNYVWISYDDNSILSRYQTQKYKLIKKGLGTQEQTEDEIMSSLNFLKIYDSGNIKLEWRRS